MNTLGIPLSVLDLAPVGEGSTPADALAASLHDPADRVRSATLVAEAVGPAPVVANRASLQAGAA